MKVEIRYKRLDSADWVNHPITPGEYFEPVDGGRPHEWDDVPVHLEAARFLPVPLTQLSETELRVYDPDGRLRLTISELFWNEARNRLIQRVEEGFELLIVQFLTGETPVLSHTVRLNREADGRLLLEHLRLVETERGQEPGPGQVLSLPASTRRPDEKKAVDLWYRLVDSGEWKAHTISSREYYAIKDGDEPANWDYPAKHMRAVDYLPFPAEQVAETEVCLADAEGRVRRIVSEVLWGGAQNRIAKQTEDSLTALTIQLVTRHDPLTRHAIRLSRDRDGAGLLEHDKDVEEAGVNVHESLARRRL
ncbi:MAG TPA: hypothetical protein VNI02_15550 [Blastocatellia bacterium]|nr:hypothetical protein [Blastocatellia bacterium]